MHPLGLRLFQAVGLQSLSHFGKQLGSQVVEPVYNRTMAFDAGQPFTQRSRLSLVHRWQPAVLHALIRLLDDGQRPSLSECSMPTPGSAAYQPTRDEHFVRAVNTR